MVLEKLMKDITNNSWATSKPHGNNTWQELKICTKFLLITLSMPPNNSDAMLSVLKLLKLTIGKTSEKLCQNVDVEQVLGKSKNKMLTSLPPPREFMEILNPLTKTMKTPSNLPSSELKTIIFWCEFEYSYTYLFNLNLPFETNNFFFDWFSYKDIT